MYQPNIPHLIKWQKKTKKKTKQKEENGGPTATEIRGTGSLVHASEQRVGRTSTNTITKHKVAAFIIIFLLPFGSGDGVISDKI